MRTVAVVAAAVGLGVVAAPAGQAQSGATVSIYSSLPLQGASEDQAGEMVEGMRLAVAQAAGRAGEVRVRYRSLDDSTKAAGNWEPRRVTANARRAVADPATVAYLGEFNSGASALSMPILNQAGIAQVSPSNTYDGLTAKGPTTGRGEPERYFPSGARTYMRLLPRDQFQGAAIGARMAADGCKRLALATDGDTYGQGLALPVVEAAQAKGVGVVLQRRVRRGPAAARSFAEAAKRRRADCVMFAGVTANDAVRIVTAAGRALPRARLYGGDGTCESGFTRPRSGGVSRGLGRRFTCFVATLALRDYPGGAAFVKAYRAKFGDGSPDPYAIYGYEAMQLVLDTLRGLGPAATDRAQVLAALLATKDRASSIGTYSFDANGDTTNLRYGVYRVDRRGNPAYAGAITP